MTTSSLKELWMLTFTKRNDGRSLQMFDDPAFFNTWIDDASDFELALLYQEWMNDNMSVDLPINFSIADECHRRGIFLADLEALLIPST
jgi:hypothetical protein